MKHHHPVQTRRRFLQSTAALALGAPAFLRAKSPNEKLNIAIIGCGGRGGANLGAVSGENIVALCDVNERNLAAAAAKASRSAASSRTSASSTTTMKRHRRRGGEHHRAHARLCHAAGAQGRQARLLREAAHALGLGSAHHPRGGAARRRSRRRWARRFTRATTTGASSSWCRAARSARCARRTCGSRAPGAGRARRPRRETRTSSPCASARRDRRRCPPGLDWDLWLGPAPERPFHDVYFPGPKWYRWWDFGSGTMSDLGSHWNDLPFWALKLRARSPSKRAARRRTRRSRPRR